MKNNLRKTIEKILKFFAQKLLNKLKPDIIGITGSVGKSSTKEAIYTVLSKSKRFEGRVSKNYGNLNEEIGVPLSIFGFQNPVRWFMWPFILIILFFKFFAYYFRIIKYPKILILELSANKVGDISYLTSFVKPHIAIVTAIGPAHIKYFGSLDSIIKEKGRLLEVLTRNDYAILNKDDLEVRNMNKRTVAKVIYFSGEKDESEKEPAKIIGKIYGLNKKEIEDNLKKFVNLPHRLNVINLVDNFTIIDDTYNANPLSMGRALKKLSAVSRQLKGKRRVVVLGDMLELGSYSEKAHQDVAQKASSVADLLITVGPNFAKTKSDHHFNNSEKAAEFLLKEAHKEDIILIKGSRGMKMEVIVQKLQNN